MRDRDMTFGIAMMSVMMILMIMFVTMVMVAVTMLMKFMKTVLKSRISPRGFGCADRELLALQICSDTVCFTF